MDYFIGIIGIIALLGIASIISEAHKPKRNTNEEPKEAPKHRPHEYKRIDYEA